MAAILAASTVNVLVASVALSTERTTTTRNGEMFFRKTHDPFMPAAEFFTRHSREVDVSSSRSAHTTAKELLSSRTGWGFEGTAHDKASTENIKRKLAATTPNYDDINPDRNGLLKDIGSINVGFGVGVGVPGNDPVRVETRVGVGFGESGLAGQLPIGQDIFPRQVLPLSSRELHSIHSGMGPQQTDETADMVNRLRRVVCVSTKCGAIDSPHLQFRPPAEVSSRIECSLKYDVIVHYFNWVLSMVEVSHTYHMQHTDTDPESITIPHMTGDVARTMATSWETEATRCAAVDCTPSLVSGEWRSLNDYDGDKGNIVPDRARKYWTAVQDGRIKIPRYRPTASLVGVGDYIGVGTGG